MDKIIQFFPSSFYLAENLMDEHSVLKLQNKSLQIQSQGNKGGDNWLCDTYNTLGAYDLGQDKDFKPLLDTIEDKVFEFTKAHNSNHKYPIKESWLNIYKEKDYQEYHYHADCTFSAVYFLKSNKNCAKIFFENPAEPDMKPIKEITGQNELTFKNCHFIPVQNSLLIFRSYMRHMVEKQKTDFERITIAVNL
tara:strand:- start:26 stop:604 length:579 start_codon:yes stop_codon:yes gene_type:complete